MAEGAHDLEVVRDEEIARPFSSCSLRSRSMIWACTDRSSAEVGSSSRMNSGSSAMARAIAMRWRWPPENSCGKRLRMLSGRPASRSACLDAIQPFLRVAADAVDDQAFLDDLADRHARIERGEGILEDDLDA